MPIIQIPLIKGQGKSSRDVDYLDLLPTNILPVMREAEGSQGYFRFYPGIEKLADVDGVSRGCDYNTAKSEIYRVLGNKLYQSGKAIADVPNTDRVSMAHSQHSQAVSTGGELRLYRYDGEVKTLSNWPAKEVTKGFEKTIQEKTHVKDKDTLLLNPETVKGELTLTLTPINGDNKQGKPLTIKQSQWATGVSQDKPAAGTPYIKNLKVQGVKFSGATLNVTYEFDPNPKVTDKPTDAEKKDISKLAWVQKVPDFEIENPQYNLSNLGYVCRHRGRYVFVRSGTDTFGLTSIEDESKIDKIAPFYRAAYMPDGIHAIRSWRDFIVVFGSATIEFYKLTGDANNLVQFVPSYMVQCGICGPHCLTEYLDSFAFITNPSSGQPKIVLMGQGNATEISDYQCNKQLANYTPKQLSQVVLESLDFDNHKLLICHLPDTTLIYDMSSKLWSTIKTGLQSGTHRAIDYRNEGNQITCGDKLSGLYGKLSATSSSQYNEDQEIILYSPLIPSEGAMLFDLELTANSGLASVTSRIMVSATEDGINYGIEKPIVFDGKWCWLGRSILRKIGRIRSKIGFKLRIVGATPATLSGLKVRAE